VAATRPARPATPTPGASARIPKPSPRPANLAKFTHETFAGRVGEHFEAIDEHGGKHALVLNQCEPGPLGWGATARGRRPFSLQFSGPGESPLSQGTYRIQHAGLGWFPLFIVPRARDASGTRYEAVFG
jgi:hypothetical protein